MSTSPTPASPVRAVAFDVNETLFSLDRVTDRLPAGTGPLWFARVLRDGFALAATGDYRPFRELAAAHLASFVDESRVDDVLSGFAELQAHDDVRPAFEWLRDAGVTCATFTNGSADLTGAMLTHNGLEDLVAERLSVDDAGLWKPRAEAYAYAAGRLGVAPGELALVAVHSWDVHGAMRAGLVGGYCTRQEGRHVDGFDPPDVTGDTLVEVVDGLLARGAGG